MAANGEEPKRRGKKKRNQTRPKLLPGEKVEVRSLEEGFLGSWHTGKVIRRKKSFRSVKYDHILCDDGSANLIEFVAVSPVIDGVKLAQWDPNSHRGGLRPLPPQPPSLSLSGSLLQYGHCVDSFLEDAWWEGVVFDQEEGSKERRIFFPDQGDDMMVSVDNLRVTQDWDELTEEWTPRGNWIFLELVEEVKQESPLFVSVKQLWYEVREKSANNSLQEWTFRVKDYWKELLSQVILDNMKLTVDQFLGSFNSSQCAEFSNAMKPETFHSNSLVSIHVETQPLSVLPLSSGIGPSEALLNKNGKRNRRINPKVPSGKLKPSRRKKDRILKWSPLEVEPEFCPEAISEFKSKTIPKVVQKRKHGTLSKARKHLLYFGWRIESAVYNNHTRFRYFSPSRQVFISLSQACNAFLIASESSCVIPPKRSQDGPSNKALRRPKKRRELSKLPSSQIVIGSEYCPQAVCNYILCVQAEGDTPDAQKRLKLSYEAKRHLVFCGWKIFSYWGRGKRQFRYVSPDGNTFYSFLKACKWHVKERELCLATYNVCDETQKDIKPSENKVEPVDVEVFRPSKVRTKRKLSYQEPSSSARLLRSTKSATQAALSSSHRTPRTILSWLIDNDVVLPETTVRYCGRKDGRPLKEGQITRNGIKCNCCQEVFSLSSFETHAGSTNHRPSANIFLEDGRSLLDCQLEMKNKTSVKNSKTKPHVVHGSRHLNRNDHICSICHDGGELILCDRCPSSFHTNCLGIKVIPDGDWFCPSCCCGICGQSRFNKNLDQFTDYSILCCHQCGHQYHFGCVKVRDESFLRQENYPIGNWFCNRSCERIFLGLNQLLGKPIPVGSELTLTFLKYTKPNDSLNGAPDNEYMTENYSKLNVALDVMHECFDPIKESRTRRDIMEDVIFSRWSELNRLNFQAFYTAVLEKNDELITVATVRVHDEKVAEIPFVSTRFQYRRLGMCRILMNGLEKKLVELGVERLVLPAVSSALDTWTISFGFSVMKQPERLNFLNYVFLDFHGTIMCQKMLTNGVPLMDSGVLSLPPAETNHQSHNGNGAILEAENFNGDGTNDQESLDDEMSAAMLSQSNWKRRRMSSYPQQQLPIALRSRVQIDSGLLS